MKARMRSPRKGSETTRCSATRSMSGRPALDVALLSERGAGEQVWQVTLDELGHGDHRLEPAVRRPRVPNFGKSRHIK